MDQISQDLQFRLVLFTITSLTAEIRNHDGSARNRTRQLAHTVHALHVAKIHFGTIIRRTDLNDISRRTIANQYCQLLSVALDFTRDSLPHNNGPTTS